MGLFEFRKQKWRHKNPAGRLESINSIDPQETEILFALAGEDQDREVRRAAISRMTDLPALGRLANNADPEDLSCIAARKETLLYDHIADCRDDKEWRDNMNQITSPDLLAKLAVNGRQPAVRLAAVAGIEDQHLLTAIVQQNCGKKPAMAALAKITDEVLLADLAESAASKTSRRLAVEKIAALEHRKNQQRDNEIIARKLSDLAAEATQLQDDNDIDSAALRLDAIKKEWQDLDPTENSLARDDFDRGCNNFEDRYRTAIQARHKRAQEKATRREQAFAQLDEICSIIERLSCVTAADAETGKEKAVADWAALLNDPAQKIVPDAALEKRFANGCKTFTANRKMIHLERGIVEDFEKKCAGIRKLIADRDLQKAAAGLAKTKKILTPIKFKFFYKNTLEKLVSDISSEMNQTAKEIHDQNLSQRQKVCTELENLADTEKPGQIEQQLQNLKRDWQQLATLEDGQGEELELRYQKLIAGLTKRLQTLQHEQDWKLWANLGLKEKLTERVVALDRQENMETVVNVIKKSQIEWKEIGPVPPKKSRELWDTFHNACNRNFERAEPYLKELKTRKTAAMERRREICALTAELAKSSDWRKTTLAIKELQEEWKTLLHGSRREEQKLYQQLRKACDHFFERRREYYQTQDKERQQHLRDKEKLCEKAELLAAEPQTDYPGKFQRLQADWRKIGPVPRKNEEAVWKRFRAACDTYFNWLEAGQLQNLERKEQLCDAVEKLVAESTTEDNQKEIATQLTELQQQWKEIGPVPREQSEAVWQRFREPCDLFFKARQRQFEKEEEQRRVNQSRKEELLAGAEDLAGQSTDKKTAAQLQELQKEWLEIGPAPRKTNKELNENFKSLCDTFFEDRRQYFIDLKSRQLDNQKKKESLCLRLENILGSSYKSGAGGRGKALSLAEELKQAMEDNFMLAGRRDEKKGLGDEVKRIRQDWEKIGPVPHKQVGALTKRYRKALDAYYKSQRTPRT